jgi:hypothetical protein
MSSQPPPAGDPPRRDSYRIFLPGGVPVLRTAVEELLRSEWNEVFRQRAWEISCAFEGSFRSAGQDDLAGISRSLTMLLEIDAREVVLLGRHLERKLDELLGKLEARLGAEGEIQTG